MLQNALDQTEGAGAFESGKWKDLVCNKIATLDIGKIREDVQPFLERPGDVKLITRENLESLVKTTD